MQTQDWLSEFLEVTVCADIGDNFQIFGTLSEVGQAHLTFIAADLHDLSDANSDRDHYASETAEIGVRVNRQKICIPRQRLIAISTLQDIR